MFIAKTPQRNVGEKKLLMVFQHAVRHVCGKPARRNCIYLNVVTRPFAGQVFGKTDDPTLAGVIANGWKFRRSATQSSHRCNINDFSGAALARALLTLTLADHDFADRLGAQKSSGQVRLDDLVPILKPHFLDGSAPGYSRVVDEYIDSPELGEGRFHHLLNTGRALDIAAKGNGFDAELLQFFGGLMAAFLLASAQHQVSAHFRQTFGHLAAQSDGPSSDDCNPSG